MRRRVEERYITVNGVELCYFRWGAPAQRTLLLLHATGFHGRCWDQVVRRLPQGSNDGDILALEARGHGRSEKTGPYDWRSCAADVVAFVDALDLERVTVMGHSMGGHLAVLAAAARPRRFEQLILLDPVILPPHGPRPLPGPPEAHPVARRRDAWTSWRAMYERFALRHPYRLWEPTVLADYCRYGLLPNPDGTGQLLACPPLVEAEFYCHAPHESGIDEAIGAVAHPVRVVRARRRAIAPRRGAATRANEARAYPRELDFSSSPTWPGLASAFADGHDIHLEALTHFIPMQDPALVAQLVTSPYI